jgi:hypothetical protein
MSYNVYDFIIKSLRDQDKDGVLERFLLGFQAIYDGILLKMELLRRLYTPFNFTTGEQLDFPLKTLGLTDEILQYLTDDQKRRLLWYLIQLWKVKGLKEGLSPYFANFAGVITSYDERFDLYWLLEDKPCAEENYVLTTQDEETVCVYVTDPFYQTCTLRLARSATGLVRVLFKNMSKAGQPSEIEAGAKLICEMKSTGGNQRSGLDLRINDSEWLGDRSVGFIKDQNGVPLNVDVATQGEDWQYREFDLSSLAGSAITHLGVYDNNEANGDEVCLTSVRRILLSKPISGQIVPLFMYKSIWESTVDTNTPNLYYTMIQDLTYARNWDLVKETARLYRPVGTIIELYAVLGRYINFMDGMSGIHWIGGASAAFPSLTFSTDDADGVPTVIPMDTMSLLGQQHYGVSLLLDRGDHNPNTTIILCKTNEQTYYKLSIDFLSGDALISRYDLNGTHDLAGTVCDVRGVRHRVFFISEGSKLSLYLNGSLAFTVDDPTIPSLSGAWEVSGHDIQLQELSVLPLPSSKEVISNG